MMRALSRWLTASTTAGLLAATGWIITPTASSVPIVDDPTGWREIFTSLEEGSLVLSGAQGGEEFLPGGFPSGLFAVHAVSEVDGTLGACVGR